MSVRETTGARAVHLAAGDEWNGFADASAALNVAGGDRLEATGSHGASVGGVSGIHFLLREIVC